MNICKRFLILGLSAALAVPLPGMEWRDPLYFAVVFYSVVGMGWGLWLHRPKLNSPWVLLLTFMLTQAVGGLIQANTDVSGTFGAGLSMADGLLLAGHVCYLAGLWQFASRLHRDFPRHGFFQGCVLATSLILLGWQFLFLPTILRYGFALDRPQTFRMIYPTVAFLEIGMLLWVWTSSQAYKSRVFLLLSAAMLCFGMGEALFHGTSASLGVPSDTNLIVWLYGYVFLGAVALHPDMDMLAAPRSSDESGHADKVLALLLPLVMLLPAGLLARHYDELHPATLGIVAGFFLLLVVGWVELRASILKMARTNRLLEQQNRTDMLTGVPNRSHMEHVIRTGAFRSDRQNGLLLIDIDGFKSINNSFGFHMGDMIIKAVAERLSAETLREAHLFARVDGDEFALLMNNIEDRNAFVAQAWAIHRLLDQPVLVNGASVRVMCSIGVSIADPVEKLNFASMLKQSERALGWAKESQSQVALYDEREDVAEDKSWVLADFRGAVTGSQLMVHYQPKVHVLSTKVIGVEALIRWQHPERGLVMPAEFLPAIEATDLAHQVFTVVLHDAVKQWHAWSAQGLVIGIALNVVARDIMHFDLVREIGDVLSQTGMPAKHLEIEITESSALSDPVHVRKVLSGLMALGVKISVDDYGTGYSSLLHLQQLPLHFLKIDQQFIRQMRTHPSSATIVSSTMELAKNLNVQVIAEGVEDAWVYHRLRSLGCYGVQGFLFSGAVAADSIVQVVREIESAA
ncbi:MAG: diguanylate cyclase/phosphodiesterase [Rhodoferax sp.]|nr:diguanylate cyclase/phosphodiesterase [Rhodoferax sp.]